MSSSDMGGEGKLCLEMGVDGKTPQLSWKGCDGTELFPETPTGDGKVEVVKHDDPVAEELAKFAAQKNDVKFGGVITGFKVIFPESERGFYYIVFKAAEGHFIPKLFFTVVKNLYATVILLFNHLDWLPHSETLKLGDNINFNIGDGDVNLSLQSAGTGEGKVQLVDPNNDDVIKAAKAAAEKHDVVFEVIKYAFKVTFSGKPFYHIAFYGTHKDGGDRKLYFTLVHEMHFTVLFEHEISFFCTLLFIDVSNTLAMEIDAEKFPSGQQDSGTGGVGKLQYVDDKDKDATEAAQFAAKQKDVKFITLALGFNIVFDDDTKFYNLLMLTQDDDESKLFFTVVADTIYPPAVVLFKHVKYHIEEEH